MLKRLICLYNDDLQTLNSQLTGWLITSIQIINFPGCLHAILRISASLGSGIFSGVLGAGVGFGDGCCWGLESGTGFGDGPA